MLADTSFLIDLHDERAAGRRGPAAAFLVAHRTARLWISVISAGEVACGFRDLDDARRFLAPFRIARLHPEIAYAAAGIDRELIARGQRLGENDNWIAGFARYYGEPLLSNDKAFDRVANLRRLRY